MYVIILILSSIAGYLFWRATAGKYAGDKSERSFIIKFLKYSIHIHHWIWCTVLLVIFLVIKYYNPLLLGFLFGSILQGLTYPDRLVIIYQTMHREKIYSRFKNKTH
jgi:hypothetical protein